MKVRDIMSEHLCCCTPETSLRDAARLMDENDCGSLPVVESERDQHPVGIITDRDITCRAVAKGRNPQDMVVADCMSTNLSTINSDADLDEVEHIMEERQYRRVPVVDENGNCVGIVAQADIARKAPERDTSEMLRAISEPVGAARTR